MTRRFRGLYIPCRVRRGLDVSSLRFMSIVSTTGYTCPPHDGVIGKLIDLGLMETYDDPRFGPDRARLSPLGRGIVSRLTIMDHMLIQPDTAKRYGIGEKTSVGSKGGAA